MVKNILSRLYQIGLLLLILLYFNSCSDEKKEIVAELGNQHITLDEFRIAYLDVVKKPDVFDSPKLREKFLDELIASRLLSQEAEKRGYYNDEKLQNRVTAYKNKALREAHFDAVIKPKISITEEDIQQAYIYSQEQRRLSHLFVNTRQEVDSIYNLLENGANFDEIARDLFDDPLLADNGGDLGWLNWDELEYDMAMTAFQMPTDTFSTPIKSQYGFHILKVTDYSKKPLITRQEYETYKHKARIKLELMLNDKYSYNYITDMVEKAEIEMNPGVITAVRSKLKNVFKRTPDQFNQMNEMQLTDDEVRLVEMNLWDMRHEIFAMINGEEYTVADFIGALNYVPYNIVYSSFRKAMHYAFRDFIIEQEARQLGLENSDDVKNKYILFKEYLLQLELRRDIVRKVKVTNQEIKQYYDQNKEKFKEAEFEQVEEIIRGIVRRKKRSEAVPNLVENLLKDRRVIKHPDVIHRYYDSVLE